MERPVRDVYAGGGVAGLEALPAIGETIARAIATLLTSGRLPMLQRLRGESDPLETLASVPGIGRRSAHRIHEELAIDTLEELEVAAHDGRLEAVLGIRGKRLAGIRDSLAQRLARVRSSSQEVGNPPSVAELLNVDREYREKAARGELPRIAPRRFNPAGEAWLPVLHATRGKRNYTALFSNTPRAHALDRTHDWVVLYADGRWEGPWTVLTARRGPLRGRRIVAGREEECAALFARRARAAARRKPLAAGR